MKKLILSLLCCLVLLNNSWSQCDYSIPKYGFASDKNLYYGSSTNYNGQEDSLFVDVYYPIASPEVQKPMVILAFGGGFFQGQRQDLASVCQEYAKRGFIAVTMDYRLGFDGPSGLNPPFAHDPAEVLRAGYRGAVDMKGAIRFMKAKHLEYGIDIDRVWTGGFSAGSIVALNAAFLDKDSEKPAACGATTPIGVKKRLDLGPIEGELNINAYDAKVQGVFNIYGALLDTNAIDVSDRIAIFSYHQTGDPVVPCAARTPYYQIAFIAENYPIVFGTCVISDRFRNNQLDPMYWKSWIYAGNQHATHDDAAVLNFMLVNANPLLCKNITSVSNNSSNLESIYLSPNPADHEVKILNLQGIYKYSILDLSGKILLSGDSNSDNIIDISTIHSGMYLLQVKYQNENRILKWIKS